MAGRFLRSGVLWTEPQLCSAFGISRTALREAVKILSAKGIVETRRKRGTILRRRSDWNLLDPDVIRWLLMVEPEQTEADLVRAMALIAVAAAQGGIAQPQPKDGMVVAAAVDRIEQVGNPFLSTFAGTAAKALQDRGLESQPADAPMGL